MLARQLPIEPIRFVFLSKSTSHSLCWLASSRSRMEIGVGATCHNPIALTPPAGAISESLSGASDYSRLLWSWRLAFRDRPTVLRSISLHTNSHVTLSCGAEMAERSSSATLAPHNNVRVAYYCKEATNAADQDASALAKIILNVIILVVLMYDMFLRYLFASSPDHGMILCPCTSQAGGMSHGKSRNARQPAIAGTPV